MTGTEPPHRSRRAWPIRTEPTTTPAGTHDHGQPRLPWLITYGSLLVLAVTVGLLLFYILGRGAQRDAQTEEIQREISDSWCLALDTLPEGGVLDLLRDKYGCGPGVPFDQLPPEVRQRYSPPSTPSVPTQTTAVPLAPAPPLGTPASPDAIDPVPNTPTATSASASPSPDPLVDLGPITEPICARLGVCI